ncbi:hypothetical protein [Gardnerella vaginalis]|uniref:hypothetical protein n=1 Tax=Gardnerella vaginalis TaxID=2702 RepID=UPI0039EFF65C
MEKEKDYEASVYKRTGARLKKLPVSQLTGQIKCQYSIQNTDDDWIACEAPFRMAGASDKGTFTYDAILRLNYQVNHNQSVSKRRILIQGYERREK